MEIKSEMANFNFFVVLYLISKDSKDFDTHHELKWNPCMWQA